MQVTVDTRRDSLGTVLAVLANAYGVPLQLLDADIDVTSATGRATAKVSQSGAAREQTTTRGGGSPKKAASKTTPARRTSVRRHANVAPPGEAKKIRAWARSQGYVVGDAGRMPAEVIAGYRAARRR